MRTKAGIKMDDLSGVQSVIFPGPNNAENKFVCIPADSTPEQWWKMSKDLVNAKRCDYAEFDGYGENFYLCFVSDCFDPPMCIVRADNEAEAVDIFVDNFAYARVTQENYGTPEEFEKAIEDGTVGVGDGSNYYDAESMQCIKLSGQAQIMMEV